jgi:apolipoprotein N-acyltransferase
MLMRLAPLAEAVMLSWGWRRAGLAAGAGALGALAMPPFGLWPVLFFTMAVAVLLLDGVADPRPSRRRFRAFLDGWLWGFGYFVAGLWWLGAAFLVEADRFAWAMPLGVMGLPAVLALFPALGFLLAHLLWRPGWARLPAFAGAMALAEMARATLFTGFPWNSLGQALAQNLHLAQSASLVGLHGLTVLALLAFAAPAVALTREAGAGRSPARALLALPLLILGGMALFGVLRIPSAATPLVEGVRLRVMQPNLPQDAKFQPARAREIIDRYLALSDRPTSPGTLGLQDTTHLIWPESAFPVLIAQQPELLRRILAALPPTTTLVTGAARAGAVLPGEGRPPIFNSILVMTREGGISAFYDKHHLVPFGEYLPEPFEQAIRALGLREFVAIPGGFSAARTRRSLTVPGLPPVAASICYEAIFPGAVLPQGNGPRPQVLLNVTNDAWFGLTPGPHQHLAQARLRAIEEGLPLIRAANNGISAVFDPYGRTLSRLDLGLDGVLDTGLPRAIDLTTFSRVGHAFAAGSVLLLLAVALLMRRRSGPAQGYSGKGR